MNLGSLVTGLLGLIFGNSFVGKGNFHEAEDGYLESTGDATNLGGALDNLGKKVTGSSLTRAEKQANAFSAQQAELAFNREADFQREMFAKQTELSNTAYQRQVSDMQAAGLNPMLALGAGGAAAPSVSSVHYSAPSSVSPGSANLGSLLSLIGLPSQLANIAADTKVKKAEAAEKNETTREKKLHNDWFEVTRELEYEGLQLSNNLSKERIEEINQGIEESKSRVGKNIAETKESEERANLAVQQSVLAKANAQNIEFMQPYLAQELETRSGLHESQRDVAIVDAAYRQRLIDSGTIEAAVRASIAGASESEVRAEVAKVEKLIKDKENAITPDPTSANVCERIVAGVRAAARSVLGK